MKHFVWICFEKTVMIQKREQFKKEKRSITNKYQQN